MRTHGWITGVLQYGAFVSLYNNVRGLIHITELGLAPGQKAEDVYRVGQAVKVTVMSVDVLHQRLKLSVRSKGGKATVQGEDVLGDIQVGVYLSFSLSLFLWFFLCVCV